MILMTTLVITITDVRYDITKDLLMDVLGRFGTVTGLNVSAPTGNASGGGKVSYTVTAVATFANYPSAEQAQKELNGRQLFPDCCSIIINLIPPSQPPQPSSHQPTMGHGMMTQSGGMPPHQQQQHHHHQQQQPPQQHQQQPPLPQNPYSSPQQSMIVMSPQGYAPQPQTGGYYTIQSQPQQPPPQMQYAPAPVGGFTGGQMQMLPPHAHHHQQSHHHLAHHHQAQQHHQPYAPFMDHHHHHHHNQHGGFRGMRPPMPMGVGYRGRGGPMMGRGAGFNDGFYGPRGGMGPYGRGMGGPYGRGNDTRGPSARIWLELFHVPENFTLQQLFILLEVYGNVAGIRREETEKGRRHLALFFMQDEGVLAMRSLDGCLIGQAPLKIAALASEDTTPFAATGDPMDPNCDNYDFRSVPHRSKLSSQFASTLKSPPSTSLFVAGLHDSVSDTVLTGYFQTLGFQIQEFRRKGPTTAIIKFSTMSDATHALVMSHGQQVVDAYLRVMYSAYEPSTLPPGAQLAEAAPGGGMLVSQN